MKLILLPLCLVLALFATACGDKPEVSGPEPTAKTSTTKAALTNSGPEIYYVRGVVKGLQPGEQKLLVDHEEIPGFMEAMTMPFNVADTNDFDGITTNDQIHFRLVVETNRSWIDQINKVGQAMNLTNQTRPMFRKVREVDPLAVGDILPNYPFTNSFGKPFNTDDFRGEVLAITLIFTRCPLPDFCPRMSANFNAMYQSLQTDASGPTNWHLMSLSFDPEFDTPSVLRFYSQRFEPDPKKWSFATGALIELDDITERFGMFFSREASGISFNHNLRTIILDPYGRIHEILIGNTWKPEDAVKSMRAAAKAAKP